MRCQPLLGKTDCNRFDPGLVSEENKKQWNVLASRELGLFANY